MTTKREIITFLKNEEGDLLLLDKAEPKLKVTKIKELKFRIYHITKDQQQWIEINTYNPIGFLFWLERTLGIKI